MQGGVFSRGYRAGRKEAALAVRRKGGSGFYSAGRGPSRKWIAALFVLLCLLLPVSFAVYVARVRGVDGGGAGSGDREEVTSQLNPDLPSPANVKVVVEKGTIITWDDLKDIRVIGYNIYRYKGEGDAGTKINAAIVSDTVYHDDEGTMFDRYAIAPVDTRGREGAVSAPVAASEKPQSIASLTPVQEPKKLTDHTFQEGEQPRVEAAEGLLDCTAAGMLYSGDWYLEHYAEVSGGTLMVTPYAGDYFSYTFAGESVVVISTRHWNYGIMEVYLDGELRAQVDLYADRILTGQEVFAASGLGPGAHNLKLVCTGNKNPSAFFTFIDLEALVVR